MSHSHTSTTCKNCGNHFSGRFCNNCGEKVYDDHDKSIFHFMEEGFHFITHVEGTLFTTLKTIFKRPGKLSLDYCDGIRKRYFKPIPLFLLLVVLYLIFPMFSGLNMQLKFYANQPIYGPYAQKAITAKINEGHYTMETLSDRFHQKSEKVSKFMLLVLIPFSALALQLFMFRKRRFFFDQMVLSAELNSFYLMWGFLLMPLLVAITNLIYQLLFKKPIPFNEEIVGLLIYGVFTWYAARAFRRFYSIAWWQSSLLATVFLFAHIFIVYGLYKFLLFVTVINQIH